MPCWGISSRRPLEVVMTESAMQPPAEPKRVTRLILFKEVQHRVGLGRSTIYRWMAEGNFPKPGQLGGYAVAWAQEDIYAWIGDIGANYGTRTFNKVQLRVCSGRRIQRK